ncbi:MAG: PAS domain S-box protein [Anaerolineales bacterium]
MDFHSQETSPTSKDSLKQQIQELRARLDEAQATLDAIRAGAVDALVVYSQEGEKIYTLEGADHPYRTLVENMNEGAATLSEDGLVLYANASMARLLDSSIETLQGSDFHTFIHPTKRDMFDALLSQARSASIRSEIEFATRNQHSVPVLLSLTPMNFAKTSGICMVASNLTEQKRREKIQAAERIASSIIEQAAEAIIVVDKDGLVVRASMAAHQIAGQNPLFKPFKEVYPFSFEGQKQFDIHSTLNGETVHSIEATLTTDRNPDSPLENQVHLLLNAAPLVDAEQEIWGGVIILTNITRHKEIERSVQAERDRLRTLIESINDEVWFCDQDGKVVLINKAVLKNLGLDPREISDKPLETIVSEVLEIFNPDGERRLTEVTPLLRSLTGEVVRGQEIIPIPRDGERHWREYTSSPIYNPAGEIQGAVAIVRDITEQKRIEESIRLANENLEKRVAERTQELAELQRRLMDSVEAERLQLSRELHDGPMQEIYAMIYRLADIDRVIDSGEWQKEVHAIQEQMRRINDVLRNISRDLRPPTLTAFGLEHAIQEHVDRLKETYKDLTIITQLQPAGKEIPETVRLALFRIYQIAITNILRHAKATRIQVRFYFDTQYIHLEIEDNGIGFEVPDNWMTLAREGHLGLISAQERAEAIGGTLHVESRLDESTLVSVVLPFPSAE